MNDGKCVFLYWTHGGADTKKCVIVTFIISQTSQIHFIDIKINPELGIWSLSYSLIKLLWIIENVHTVAGRHWVLYLQMYIHVYVCVCG